MKNLLLIDTHALIHRFFHALPPLTTPKGAPIQAIYGLARILVKIVREEKPTYIAAAFDRPEKTFRSVEFADYKAHRPKAADDLIVQFDEARKLFEEFGIRTFESPGFEADDIIGTIATTFKETPDVRIEIASGDLDLLQLVSGDKTVVRIVKNGLTNTVIYNEDAVKERYGLLPSELTDYKGLVGDTSDNIPGVKGIGPKTASELLQEFKSLEGILESLSIINPRVAEKIGAHQKEALLSKKLATIKIDVPIPLPLLADLKTPPLNTKNLKTHFELLGFTSLIREMEA